MKRVANFIVVVVGVEVKVRVDVVNVDVRKEEMLHPMSGWDDVFFGIWAGIGWGLYRNLAEEKMVGGGRCCQCCCEDAKESTLVLDRFHASLSWKVSGSHQKFLAVPWYPVDV